LAATRATALDLTKYDDTFLECRDLRHSWVALGFYRHNGHVQRQLQCSRCMTTRTDTWTPGGGRARNGRYRHATGYLLSGKPRNMSQGEMNERVRAEVIRRHKVYTSEEQMLNALFGASKGRKK
jgi:hypothetical protein